MALALTNYFQIRNMNTSATPVTIRSSQIEFFYSLSQGSSFGAWTSAKNSPTVSLNSGQALIVKGDCSAVTTGQIAIRLGTDGEASSWNVSGKISSLIDNGTSEDTVDTCPRNLFNNAFSNKAATMNITNLQLNVRNPAPGAFQRMFYNCTGVTEPRSTFLNQIQTISSSLFSEMFCGCTQLTKIFQDFLPKGNLAQSCFYNMFKGCTGLITIQSPETLLPYTNLANKCYEGMFEGCTFLQNAPDLPATELKPRCYARMFYEDSSIRQIKCSATSWTQQSQAIQQPTYQWVYGVANDPTCVFVATQESLEEIRDQSHIPVKWILKQPIKPANFQILGVYGAFSG